MAFQGLGSLPALQIDNERIAAVSPLEQFRQGSADQIQDNQRSLLRNVGSQAASGNYLAAGNTAMRGGEIDMGMKLKKYPVDLRNSDRETMMKAHEFLTNGVQRADTPEKWKALVTTAGSIFGPEMVSGYESFERRPAALTAMQEAQIQLQQAEGQRQAEEHSAKMPLYAAQASKADAEAKALTAKSYPSNPGYGWENLKDRANAEEGLRKEVHNTNKEYSIIRDSANKIEAIAKAPSAASDMALVFSFMKILDPTSVVRETEYATAQNAAGVPDRIQNIWNKVLAGEFLTEKQRLDFLSQARTLAKTQTTQYQKSLGQYRGVAERLGVDPKNVILDDDVEAEMPPEMMNAMKSGKTIQDPTGKKWRLGADGRPEEVQ